MYKLKLIKGKLKAKSSKKNLKVAKMLGKAVEYQLKVANC